MAKIRARNESGSLYLDFSYRGIRCREQTALKDTTGNRVKLEQLLKRIEREITQGSFSYRAYFPSSKRASLFEAQPPAALAPTASELQDAAAKAVSEMGAQSSLITLSIATDPLFAVFADHWYKQKEVEWMHSTQVKVTDILRKHLMPRFKGRRVSDISKDDILNLRTHLAKDHRDGKGLSSSRINGILNILHQILADAADRYNFSTPFRGIKSLRVAKTEVDPLSLPEVTRFLTALEAQHRPYYTVAFLTALRPSEQNALKWANVDFERMQILVREAFVYGEIDVPKTPGSDRAIAMSSIVAQALREQKTLSADKASEYVFCQGNGTPVNYRNMATRVWHPTFKALGLRRRKPYQTRHTAATLWLAAGEAPEWIARQMGHTTTKMLFGTYSRFVPNVTRTDGSAFEQLLLQSGTSSLIGSSSVAANETAAVKHDAVESHHG